MRTRLSSELSEAAEAEPALDDSSDSEDTLAAMLATGTATPPDTATPPSATNQVSVHSADVNSARRTRPSQPYFHFQRSSSLTDDLPSKTGPQQQYIMGDPPHLSRTGTAQSCNGVSLTDSLQRQCNTTQSLCISGTRTQLRHAGAGGARRSCGRS